MDQKIAVVIPAYKCRAQIISVIRSIPPFVSSIIVVDDCCPEGTGEFVLKNIDDSRVFVIKNPQNLGVGGAVIAGYKRALELHCDIVVKIDGDGQMDPSLIERFIEPIKAGIADYTKGNRFSKVEHVQQMPIVRFLGNIGLSFVNKVSSGYWRVLDPTNGYTSISAKALSQLPFQKISNRYFFESDMLFRLGLLDINVVDIPMESKYEDEKSNLSAFKSLFEFSGKHLKNFFKRIMYQYFILDFNLASLELLFGIGLSFFGLSFGIYKWHVSSTTNVVASSGTVMMAAFPLLVGVQLFLAFLGYDMSRPRSKLSK